MDLIVVHYHFRPGGVRRVIELATPHLVIHAPERVRTVVLATGEAPDPTWLRCFRRRLRGTRVDVVVEPAFGYESEQVLAGEQLRTRVKRGVLKLLRRIQLQGGLIWAHNLGLGRNLILARELATACDGGGVRLVSHHHDWWFENRWHHVAGMREPGLRGMDAVANAILPASPRISLAAINQADARVLQHHFPHLAGWLPNPVERPQRPSAARVRHAAAWLRQQLGDNAPVWLLPCRLLRRKNIAEALLLTRWLRPEAWLVTTGGVSSNEERAYAEALAEAAEAHGWRLRLGLLQGDESLKPSVPELLAASEVVLLTSLQEGFGLPYLEAAAARRPLVARQLPNIAPDLAEFGFTFPQSYGEVRIHPALFNWRAESRRQQQLFAEWRRAMPRAAARLVGEPAVLAGGPAPHPVPFSRLTLTAQIEVLTRPVEQSWEQCRNLNPFLKTWRERAATGQMRRSAWPRSATRSLGGGTYARRFHALVPSRSASAPPVGSSRAAQSEFLGQKLRAENLYPLLWHSRT